MDAEKKKLIYVSDEEPGIRRKRHGKGFSYWFESGRKVTGQRSLKRIKELMIPPALQDVWICRHVNGHLQATGWDSKERKQYFYHEDWVKKQQQRKFDQLIDFAYSLPKIRKKIRKDLQLKKWSKKKVTALVISLLDESYMRIGNRYYTSENNSYGLTTLRRKHTKVKGEKIFFSYEGKSGQQREVNIENSKLARLVKKCSELPGYELFRYYGENSKPYVLNSSDVNEYLQNVTGKDFTSKDFRAWGATVEVLNEEENARKVAEASRKSFKKELIRRVAKQLGNTTSVCEKYYIHPAVLQAVLSGESKEQIPSLSEYHKLRKTMKPEEIQALYLIEIAKSKEETSRRAA